MLHVLVDRLAAPVAAGEAMAQRRVSYAIHAYTRVRRCPWVAEWANFVRGLHVFADRLAGVLLRRARLQSGGMLVLSTWACGRCRCRCW